MLHCSRGISGTLHSAPGPQRETHLQLLHPCLRGAISDAIHNPAGLTWGAVLRQVADAVQQLRTEAAVGRSNFAAQCLQIVARPR
jgi:hypothetical protein